MQYTKTNWLDHIVDGSGNVVQQGTPLSAGNLGKLEKAAKDALVETAPELAQNKAHSGVLDWAPLQSGWFSSVPRAEDGGIMVIPGPQYTKDYPNMFAVQPFRVLIYGQVLKLGSLGSGGWVRFDLPAAPAVGERDDLILLEAWRDQTTQDWQVRTRIIAGVDFSTYPVDGLAKNANPSAGDLNQAITAQGGNASPVAWVDGWDGFRKANNTLGTSGWRLIDDAGLYVAGQNTETSKGRLKTYDGYVFVIPLFKVRRRNSGGFSVTNPNGAKDSVPLQVTTGVSTTPGVSANFTLKAGQGVNVKAGDRIYFQCNGASAIYVDVTAVNGDVITGTPSFSGSWNNNSDFFGLKSDRPDGLFSNIIDERDLLDLRHKVYLAAPSYQQLLIDGLDQHLRGATQPERRKISRKTYVGVRKTPIDGNHTFYASFDGSLTPEVGTFSNSVSGLRFTPGPTGAAVTGFSGSNFLSIGVSLNEKTDNFCIDLFYKVPTTFVEEYLWNLAPASGNSTSLGIMADGQLRLTLHNPTYDSGIGAGFLTAYRGQYVHIRVDYRSGYRDCYVNGVLKATQNLAGLVNPVVTTLNIGGIGGYKPATSAIADFSLSSVNRGAIFATLPSDLIAGYADLAPALSYQRRNNSDVLNPQKTYAVAKVQNQTQERGVTVTKGAGVNTAIWEAGDKIKVRGLAGEIIGGVIDSDTALAKVAQTATNVTTFAVDDVSKLAVNDTITILGAEGGLVYGTKTITAVDTNNKTITINSTVNVIAGQIIAETTASTSSPVVRAIIAGTSTNVPGTWANLGTNEAEVTLGTLPGGLNAADIIIEYSLNMPQGQGGLYQVYANILTGEANGKKLVKGTLAAADDFVGKIAGSTTVNPNKAYFGTNGTTATPAAPGTEFTQADYDAIKSKDNSLKTVSTAVNGQSATALIAIDVIRNYEDRFGKIPGTYSVAEKVAWLRSGIVSKLVFSVWAYGAGPTGNKCTLLHWNPAGVVAAPNNTWRTSAAIVTTSGAITLLSETAADTQANFHGNPANMIDDAGMLYYLVYAEPSDGVTPSVLYVDHSNIEIHVAAKTGYDMLVPENPRRDAGLAGILYVRRQTREVESLFPGNDEDNGIVVYGDYIPQQEYAASLSGTTDLLLGMQGFVTVAGTNRAYGTSSYANAIARLLGPGDDLNYKVDPQSLASTLAYDQSDVQTSGLLRYFYPELPHGLGISTGVYTDGIPSWAAKAAEFLVVMPALVLYNGEILLRLTMRKRSGLSVVGLGGVNGITISSYLRLPGRPLMKV